MNGRGKRAKRDGDGTILRLRPRRIPPKQLQIGSKAQRQAAAPATSWWIAESREAFQAAAERERERMRGNPFGRMREG